MSEVINPTHVITAAKWPASGGPELADATPPPPPPPITPPTAPSAGAPREPEWWRGTTGRSPGSAPASVVAEHAPPAVIYAAPPAIYLIGPAAPTPPARFSIKRARPLRNVSAALVGYGATGLTNGVLHQVGDSQYAFLAALIVALLNDVRSCWDRDARRPRLNAGSWWARVLSFNLLASCFATTAGLEAISWIMTGA